MNSTICPWGSRPLRRQLFPESSEDLAVHAYVELDLFRGPGDDGSRHDVPDGPRPISPFLQKLSIHSKIVAFVAVK